jgi:hypothetical protein
MITYSKIKEEAEIMEVDLQWALDARKRYLNSGIGFRADAINDLAKSLSGHNSVTRALFLLWMEKHKNEIETLQREIIFLKPSTNVSKSEVTDTMIQKAREYPIETILPNPIRRNVTNCIAHDDTHPSMGIKNNRVRCFSCGFSGDAISVYMYLNNADFKTAVKELN